MGSPLRSMLYLYVLLVLSLAALLWAVWAIAKHVRQHAAVEHESEDLSGLQRQMRSRLPAKIEATEDMPSSGDRKENGSNP